MSSSIMTSQGADQKADRPLDLAVMFTDIVDYAAYCETHGEDAGLALVTRYQDLVIPIVKGNAGNVVKTIGDKVMAYFADPVKAALAGQQIIRAVDTADATRPREEAMHLRVALQLGPVAMKDNDLFGNTVNLASRMLSLGRPDQILISRSMIDALGDHADFICRFVGTTNFYGKTGVVELYELLTKMPELKQRTKSRTVSDRPAPEEPAVDSQKLLGGKYFIERLIDKGTYGRVYKTRNGETGEAVAIKLLPEEAYIFYVREAQVLRQLQPFPYVIEILDAFVEPQGLCIVMPYIPQGSLQTYMNKLNGMPLEPGQVISLMQELLAALAHAHAREVIHRDVKPQNILLREAIETVLTDFGIAHAVESTGRATTHTKGTSGFIAPEITSGRFDHTVDIYSAGVVLYRMLGGQFPMNLDTLPPSTHPDFRKIIGRATAPRNKRYALASEMLEDIRELGLKIIGPTIQRVAQAEDERILVLATESSWNLIGQPIKAMNLTVMQCKLADLIKKLHWHVPAVTILDFVALTGSTLEIPTHIRLCQALGTKVIVVNCPSEVEAKEMIKLGASDCVPWLEVQGAVDTLKSSIETLITQMQLGREGSWWKRILG